MYIGGMTVSLSMEFSKALTQMQMAVDMVSTSPHPTNKVAANLFGEDWSVTRTNHWPHFIDTKIGRKADIGNSSGTIHAETACILTVPQPTEGASICITDPCCPNCAKNIAEAGIKNVFIDSKGFKKDFFARRGAHFKQMSIDIFKHAGINVYEVNRKEKTVTPIYIAPDGYTPPEDSPIIVEPIQSAVEAVLHIAVGKASQIHHRRKYAMAFAEAIDGTKHLITARAHAVTGYSMTNIDEALEIMTPVDKYSFIQEPVNRLMMFLARKGWRLIDGYLYASQIPTAREQVNIVGAGVRRITIGDMQKSRDPHGHAAMEQLKNAGILQYD